MLVRTRISSQGWTRWRGPAVHKGHGASGTAESDFRCPTPRDASDSRRDAACRVSGSWGKMETRHTPVSPGGRTCRGPNLGRLRWPGLAFLGLGISTTIPFYPFRIITTL